ncbi:DNA-protecting protein DprA, partial [Ruminococcaceae bacterium OttesenSCG-928-N02]|nr:DNA-protecting protein DprA [Ruminococcaceae bacterium OttesenSCG-928-N02]
GSIFSLQSEGTNALLKEGAAPVTRAQDILNFLGIEEQSKDLNPQPTAQPDEQFSAGAQAAQKALGATPKSLEEICEQTGLAPGPAMAALGELEMFGAARHLPGHMYTLAI